MATTTAAAGGVDVAKELKRPYVLVLVLLAIVTVLEVQVPSLGPWFGVGRGWQTALLLISSSAKASLVGLYYMHLKYEPRLLRLIPVGPIFFAVALAIVIMAH